jgi:tetratricopeptide (TPR) repeat protein
MTSIRKTEYEIPTATLQSENPLPIFRDREKDRPSQNDETLTEAESCRMGWESGYRVLPYRLQDDFTRNREKQKITAIEMESEKYRAVILPDYGARLFSLIDKEAGKELLYCNDILQPANLAIRKAWFAGGVEWNIGQLGHTFSTCSSLFAGVVEGADGSCWLRMYEFERCKGLFWQVDLHLFDELYGGKGGLAAHVKVVNPRDIEIPMYWWTNISLPEVENSRVLAPADRCLYKLYNVEGFGAKELPYLPTIDNKDGSYPVNHTQANELFFQCRKSVAPWQTLAYENGDMFVEYSSSNLTTRKLFCWGSHSGGRHWQEYLCGKERPYIEIQAGLTPVQLCSIPMEAKDVWHWTQVFGSVDGDKELLHSDEWSIAVEEAQKSVQQIPGYRKIDDLHTKLTQFSHLGISKVIHTASGWGALEIERMKRAQNIPDTLSSFSFPEETVQTDQRVWLNLLETGELLPENDDSATGLIDWMVQNEWKEEVEKIPEEKMNWFSYLILGVMQMEQFEYEKAGESWKKSLACRKTALALRNLAQLYLRTGQEAEELLHSAYKLADSNLLKRAVAEEYMALLMHLGKWIEAVNFYLSTPAYLQDHEILLVQYAKACLKINKLDSVEKILTSERNFALIQEGELSLSDLWYELWAKRIALEAGVEMSEEHIDQAHNLYPVPWELDFRMT